VRPVEEKTVLRMIAGLTVTERQLRLFDMDDFERFLG
jgi:hypothetical protein